MGDKEPLVSNQVRDDSTNDTKNPTTSTAATAAVTTTLNSNHQSSTKSNVSSGGSNRPKMSRGMPLTGTQTVKPNTILSLEDRDIVVIDSVDYKESTSSENTVIVVEKPRPYHHHQSQQPSSASASSTMPSQQTTKPSQDIDLADLLETNWPAVAGDLAVALSTRSTSSAETNASNATQFSGGSGSTSSNSSSSYQLNTVITERNRSKNPLAHLGQPKIRRNVIVNAKTTNSPAAASGNLINLDSDGSSSTNEHAHGSSNNSKSE